MHPEIILWVFFCAGGRVALNKRRHVSFTIRLGYGFLFN
jgi:hypothetical protein